MEARAIQRGVRQSARKMRLVIDLIRGQAVPEADAILRFSKKRAARQIHKVLQSAVANAQQAAQRDNAPFDADGLRVTYAVVNEGQTLKRFTAAAMGRGTPILKRTSHVEIRVAGVAAPAAPAPTAKAEAKETAKPRAKAKKSAPAKKKKTTKKAGKKGEKKTKLKVSRGDIVRRGPGRYSPANNSRERLREGERPRKFLKPRLSHAAIADVHIERK